MIKAKKTIAIIPARGNSKRLPGKNMMMLNEIPLIGHSILYAKKCDFIDEVYVTTDNDFIKSEAIRLGAQVIDRPKEISGDFEPTISALVHALLSIDETVENVILLQPTNPLRPINLLSEAFLKFQLGKYDSLFTVSENREKYGKIHNNKFIPFNYKIGQRSQDLEPLFYENGLLYITKSKTILENKIITEDAFPYVVNHIFAKVDIDTAEDFEFAEFLIKRNKE